VDGERQVPCPLCHGETVRCRACDGTGKQAVSSSGWVECPACHGTGLCPVCDGAGHTTPDKAAAALILEDDPTPGALTAADVRRAAEILRNAKPVPVPATVAIHPEMYRRLMEEDDA